MNRTTHSNPGLTLQEFFEQNRRLLIFLAVFLAGVLGGVLIFTVSHASMEHELSLMLDIPAIQGGFQGACRFCFLLAF